MQSGQNLSPSLIVIIFYPTRVTLKFLKKERQFVLKICHVGLYNTKITVEFRKYCGSRNITRKREVIVVSKKFGVILYCIIWEIF